MITSAHLNLPIKSKNLEKYGNEYLKVSCCSMQGRRKTMEDLHGVSLDIIENTSVICVVDGHNGKYL